jgi:predicted uridylate kinase
MKTIVVSLGGSILSTEKGFDVDFSKEIAAMLNGYKDTRFIIATGGGYAAGSYVDSLRGSVDVFSLDEVGMAITKINALALKVILERRVGDVHPIIPDTLGEVRKAAASHRVVVMGGLLEGVTTDADAIIACEATGSNMLINISKTAYVYDKDPKEKGAKRLERLTHDEMIDLAHRYDQRAPRTHFVFDLVASKLAKRSNITVYFTDANMANIKAIIEGRKSEGTVVK